MDLNLNFKTSLNEIKLSNDFSAYVKILKNNQINLAFIKSCLICESY